MTEHDDEDSTRKMDVGHDEQSAHPSRPPHESGAGDDGGNALPPGSRLGEFEIRSAIGEGGFSIVYEAWDHSLHRTVALKEYIPAGLALRSSTLMVTARSQRNRETFQAGLKSFINEARLLAHFDHPALVKVHRFWEANGTAYMVMPLYKGVTLKSALTALEAPADEAFLKRLLGPVMDALEVIHAQNCFHRDIAPDNIILVEPTQSPLLLDFGAARRVVGDLTHDLTVILKKGYAPLEQYGEIQGMHQGPWTDIYALGAVLHYAIRGKTPPPSVSRIANDTYVPLADTSKGLYSDAMLRAIDHALAVRPENRPQSIAEFRKELRIDDLGSSVRKKTPLPIARNDEVERRTFGLAFRIAAGLCAATALAVLGYVGWNAIQPRNRTEPAPTPVAAAKRTVVIQSAPPASPGDATSSPIDSRTVPIATVAPSIDQQQTGSAKAGEPAESADQARARQRQDDARREFEGIFDDLQQLAQTEKRDDRAVVQKIAALRERGDAEASSRHYDAAGTLYQEGTAMAKPALNSLVDEVVLGYVKVAKEATAMGSLQIAQRAVDRAKAVQALKRK